MSYEVIHEEEDHRLELDVTVARFGTKPPEVEIAANLEYEKYTDSMTLSMEQAHALGVMLLRATGELRG